MDKEKTVKSPNTLLEAIEIVKDALDKRASLLAQVEEAYDVIDSLQSRGISLPEIVDLLKKDAGFKISVSYLRATLKKIKARKEKEKNKDSVSAPASPVVVAPAPAPVAKPTSTPPLEGGQVVEKAVVVAEKPAISTEKTNFREVMRLKREAMEAEVEYEHL